MIPVEFPLCLCLVNPVFALAGHLQMPVGLVEPEPHLLSEAPLCLQLCPGGLQARRQLDRLVQGRLELGRGPLPLLPVRQQGPGTAESGNRDGT